MKVYVLYQSYWSDFENNFGEIQSVEKWAITKITADKSEAESWPGEFFVIVPAVFPDPQRGGYYMPQEEIRYRKKYEEYGLSGLPTSRDG